MERYLGGDAAGKGTYVDLTTGQFLSFPEATILPGTAATRYYRVPVWVVIVAGPLMGLAYIIFLPLVAIGSLVAMALYRVRQWTRSLAHRTTAG